jgi:hypothetical protein
MVGLLGGGSLKMGWRFQAAFAVGKVGWRGALLMFFAWFMEWDWTMSRCAIWAVFNDV